MTRWLLRSPDTIVNHNNPRYGRDQITMVQQDKNKWLLAASKMGGEASMYSRIKAGVKTEVVPMETIIEESLEDVALLEIQKLHPDAMESTKELLSMKVRNTLEVRTFHTGWKVLLYVLFDSFSLPPLSHAAESCILHTKPPRFLPRSG